jgi:F-type H+-transporting ATPase subunit delta
MSTLRTIARPYSKAVFEQALANKQLEPWLNVLNVLAHSVQNKYFSAVIHNPKFTDALLCTCLLDLCQPLVKPKKHGLKRQLTNFINLLIANKRIAILPHVFECYQQLLRQHHAIAAVKITSAFTLSRRQRKKLETVLINYLQQHLDVDYFIDQSLIGGVIIHTSTVLIDSSIKNQLARLYHTLNDTIGDIDS